MMLFIYINVKNFMPFLKNMLFNILTLKFYLSLLRTNFQFLFLTIYKKRINYACMTGFFFSFEDFLDAANRFAYIFYEDQSVFALVFGGFICALFVWIFTHYYVLYLKKNIYDTRKLRRLIDGDFWEKRDREIAIGRLAWLRRFSVKLLRKRRNLKKNSPVFFRYYMWFTHMIRIIYYFIPFQLSYLSAVFFDQGVLDDRLHLMEYVIYYFDEHDFFYLSVVSNYVCVLEVIIAYYIVVIWSIFLNIVNLIIFVFLLFINRYVAFLFFIFWIFLNIALFMLFAISHFSYSMVITTFI